MFDIVTVGSAVSDVFVKTPPGSSKVEKHRHHQDVCYHIGSKILISDIHFETGGGGTNAAVAFARLGFNTGYVGKLGLDANTNKMLEELKTEKVTFLGKCVPGQMGFSVIIVGLQNDRTILTYKGLNNSLEVSDVDKKAFQAKRYYFSSMLGQSWKTALKIAEHAYKNHIPYTFNPSHYLVKEGLKVLKPMLRGCELLTLNKEEAEELSGLPNATIHELLLNLHQHVHIVIITDGKHGAYACDGTYFYTVVPRPVKVVETTGAGDSFASGVTAGLAWRMDLEDCLKMGMLEAESVISAIGAKNILLSKKELISRLHQSKPPRVFKERIKPR